MKKYQTLTIILVVTLVLSLGIAQNMSANTDSSASISDISTSTIGNDATFESEHKVRSDRVENHREKSPDEVLSPVEIFNKFQSIEKELGMDQYAESNKYDPEVKQLNQFIVTFDSVQAKNSFVQSVDAEFVVQDYNLLPSVVVVNDPMVKNYLLQSTAVVDLTADVLIDLPSYEMAEKDNADTAMFNSEGRIGAWDFHDLGYTGKDVKIAVLDTGIDASHQDLQTTSDGSPKIIAAQSFVPGEGVEDNIGHGTHVAGTTAGNGYHIGVAPDAQLLNAKVCSFGGCAYSWMLEAIEWSIEMDVDIITMSIGGSTLFGKVPLDAIIEYAWDNGIVITVAAGNAGPGVSTVSTPGTAPHVLTVAATDVYDKITAFSGRGPSVYGHFDPDIGAPGMGIFSTLPGNTYGIYTGTSMATPHTAGAAALLMEAHPRANNDEIKANMMASANHLEGFGVNEQGAGMIDLINTHDNWEKRQTTIFPLLTEADTFYLTPGETYTGYFDLIRGNRGFVPNFYYRDHGNVELTIDDDALNPWVRGHQFIPFSITVPTDASAGDILTEEVKISYLPFKMRWHHARLHAQEMTITVEVVDSENDAGLGFDASDTFVGATPVGFGDFQGYGADIDFYKVELTEGVTYTIELGGMSPNSDFDFAVYDQDGVLSCDVCNIYIGGPTPESVELTAQYSGYYYMRVDPWSVLYIDPYLGIDTSGPYTISMTEGSSGPGDPGEEPTGTQFDFISADVYGLDEDTDGINDYLAVDVTVDVTSTGLLDAYAFLTLDKGGPTEKWFFAVAFVEWYEFTETGVQTFTMTLDAMNFADQQFTGDVVLYELFMGDPSTFTILHDLYDVDRSTLSSADFGPTHMTYQTMSATPIDIEDDGIADLLEVAVTVEIGETFPFFTYFYATLYHPDGYYVYSANEAEIDLSVAGDQMLYFYFYPDSFLTDTGGDLDLELLITYAFEHPLSMITEHFDWYPYILTLGDVFTVDQSVFGGSTGTNSIINVSDFTYDTDGDGLFDYLYLDVTVDIGTAGYYSVSYHPWVWSIPGQEVMFDFSSDAYENIQYLEPGIQSLYLTISGELINSLEIEAPLMFLNIWLDTWVEEDSDLYYDGEADMVQNYITHAYDADEFDTAGVKYLGVSGVNYVDFTGDGLAETVEVQIDLEVGYPGEFSFFFVMQDYPLGGYKYFDVWSTYEYFDTPGLHTISLYLDGRQFYQQEYTGLVEFWEIDVFNAFTGEFTYFDFQNGLFEVDYTMLPGAAPAGEIGGVTDYPLDVNDNGLYDYVAVDVTIEVRQPSEFFVFMDAVATENFNYVGYDSEFFYAASAGSYVVTLLISGSAIKANVEGDSTALQLYIYLEDGAGFADQVSVITDVYDLTMFETVAEIVSVSDSPIDDNGNGLYEYVAVDVYIEVNAPGFYYLNMDVWGGEDFFDYVGFYFGDLYAEGAGTYIVRLLIPASDLINNIFAEESQLELWLWLYNEQGFVDDAGPIYTDFYDLTMFETPAQIISIEDFGEDLDSNGLYEFITINVTVEVNAAGDFGLELSMYGNDDEGYSEFVVGYYNFWYMEPGVHELKIQLPTSLILSRLTDDFTDFLVFITLRDNNAELDFTEYFTSYYAVEELEYIVEFAGFADYGDDTDSDSLYEFLMIEVTMDISKAGDFTLWIDLFGDFQSNFIYVGAYTEGFSTTGAELLTVSVAVPAADILNAGLEPETSFGYYAIVLDSNDYVVNLLGFIETGVYSLADFDES